MRQNITDWILTIWYVIKRYITHWCALRKWKMSKLRSWRSHRVALVGDRSEWDGNGLFWVIRCSKLLQCGLHTPDLTGVLGDGTIAGELARTGDVEDHFLGPLLGFLFEEEELLFISLKTFSGYINGFNPYLIQSVDFVLAFDVFLIISKHLEPAHGEQKEKQF